MTDAERPLTAADTVGQWLDHPEGGPLLRDLLAAAGRTPADLAPALGIPLGRLAGVGGGPLSADAVTDLVRRANGGRLPEASDEAAGWRERIVPGRFEGRTVVVTGAGSGIGRATASRVAREGGRVIAVDLSGDGLDALVAELPGLDVVTVTADITDPADVARVVSTAGERIAGLANIAGVADDMTPVHEVSDAVWRRTFAVNVDGTFLMSRAVVPVMLAGGGGSIVNIASEAALRGGAAGAAYTAAKHAVVGLTKNCAFMYGPLGIRVNAVAPGPVLTGMRPVAASRLGGERLAAGRALLPEIAEPVQLAASITFLLSDDGTNVSGAVLASDGGWSAA